MKVIYLGLFISDVCKPILLDYWDEITNSQLLENIKASHITLKYKPSKKDLQSYLDNNGVNYNELVPITITGYAQNEFAQAFKVNLPIQCDNINPHITISVADDIQPKYSNELLEQAIKNNLFNEISGGLKLYCKLNTFPEHLE